jgi:acyl-CoA synthetase (NDP forming)/GNAT superfamily N-acetyltransferase
MVDTDVGTGVGGGLGTGIGTGVDAIRVDGGLIHLRPPGPGDRAGLLALNAGVSDQSIYNRFFILDRHVADAYVDRLLRPPDDDHEALLAFIGTELVGVGAFERFGPAVAELGLLIGDAARHQGVGTLLMEHLAAAARPRGISRFVAEILAQNVTMLRAVRSLGFTTTSRIEDEVVLLSFDLAEGAAARAAIGDRDRRAAAASLQRLLSPRSIAVLGDGATPGAVGHEVLTHILAGGFTGTVELVDTGYGRPTESTGDSAADAGLGVPTVATVADLTTAPDLAIITVAAAEVPDAVAACGRRGAWGVLVLTAGFGETGAAGAAAQRVTSSLARSYGMRMIGPNCLGLVNTDPAVRLNATVTPVSMIPGGLGLVSQSGALGAALIAAAEPVGLHVAQFVSVGNKADVSGNDLLLAWEGDDRVSVVALYLESFGNPRRFARIARRVARNKPVIAVKAGRSPAGQRAGLSHTAAAAAADPVVDALFAEAGVLRVDTIQQLLDIARVLTGPQLAGGRIAIVGNSGGLCVLAADAAAAAGLTVVELDDATAGLLRDAAPGAVSYRNPVGLGAGARGAEVISAVRVLLAAEDVDAVLTVFTDLVFAEPGATLAAVAAAAAGTTKPVVAVQVGGGDRAIGVPGGSRTIPVFGFPEAAAAALGAAHRYARLRTADDGDPVRPDGIDPERARALIAARSSAVPGWLAPEDAVALLDCFAIGRPAAPGPATPALPVTPVELVAGVVQDPRFGPLVMLGAGGPFAGLVADRQLRLAPLTDAGADQMISGLRLGPLLDGDPGRPEATREMIRGLLVRLATLADDLPDVAELDLNVAIAGQRVVVGAARVRLASATIGADPQLRQLGAPR